MDDNKAPPRGCRRGGTKEVLTQKEAGLAASLEGDVNPSIKDRPIEVVRYAFLGALFGACFPIGSIIFLLASGAVSSGSLLNVLRECHRNSLLWVIDTAPLFLGVFAAFAGARQDRIVQFSHELERQVEEKTESLRQALKEAEEANRTIAHMADHDALTGLQNRRRFEKVLQVGINSSMRHGRSLSLLFIDLDNFKPINDRYGHAAGDNYLVHVANLLSDAARCTDCVTRIGGDEFAIVLHETDPAMAVKVAEKVLFLFAKSPMLIQRTPVTVSACIGIAGFPRDAVTAASLISCADMAMYEAKKGTKNSWFSYDLLNRTE